MTGLLPAIVRLFDEGEHDSTEPKRAHTRTEKVDAPTLDVFRPRHRRANQRQRDEDKRYVQGEDPAPRDLIDDQASSQGPHDRRDPSQAVHDPIAAPRSAGPNAATMIASELGVTNGSRSPLSARARSATRCSGPSTGNRATPNATRPSPNTRRSP